MPMGLIGRLHAGPPELLVDHELGQRVGVEPEGRGPVGHDVARLGELAAGGVRVLGEPLPDPEAAGIVVAREAEVHAGSVGSASRFTHLGGGGGGRRGSTDEWRRMERRMTDWNYADVWETVADVQPDAVAITQGDRNLTWDEFDRGADGVAQFLLDLGVAQQDKVAVYLYNSPEYLQATFAAMKVGLVPVNTNYRYGDDELSYLWDNADAVAVVFHGTFTERIERILDRVPGVKGWLWVDDGSGPCPDWATPYEDAAKSAIGRVRAPWGRSGDDLYMLYTGGTTGMPKGVMWRQDDLFARLIDGGVRHYDVNGGLEGVRAALEASPVGVTLMPACPLMHGTGAFTANTVLAEGGRVCLLESRKYDPVEMLDTIEREKVNGLVIVGDPFSRPLLAVLDENPGQVGPELAHDDHLVGCDVERAGQGAPARPPRRACSWPTRSARRRRSAWACPSRAAARRPRRRRSRSVPT